jgi:hypothetical protein
MVDQLLRTGTFQIRDHIGTMQPGTLPQLHGMLNFIDSVDLYNRYLVFTNGPDRDSLRTPARDLTVREFGTLSSKAIGGYSSRELLFRRFLIYSCFYAAQKPTIVCEGPTDNVYLLHAIHALAPLFPDLATLPTGGPPQLRVRLFDYVGTRTGRLLGLSDGGGSPLGALIDNYIKITREFKAPISSNPTIILVDNDSGRAAVDGAMKKHKVPVSPGVPFVHIKGTLYMMSTPPIAGKADTEIEDFFDSKTRAIQINGKSFNPAKGADPSKYFGKTVFAHKVVRPNAKSIDFAGFAPLLATISAIIKHLGTLPLAPPKPAK